MGNKVGKPPEHGGGGEALLRGLTRALGAQVALTGGAVVPHTAGRSDLTPAGTAVGQTGAPLTPDVLGRTAPDHEARALRGGATHRPSPLPTPAGVGSSKKRARALRQAQRRALAAGEANPAATSLPPVPGGPGAQPVSAQAPAPVASAPAAAPAVSLRAPVGRDLQPGADFPPGLRALAQTIGGAAYIAPLTWIKASVEFAASTSAPRRQVYLDAIGALGGNAIWRADALLLTSTLAADRLTPALQLTIYASAIAALQDYAPATQGVLDFEGRPVQAYDASIGHLLFVRSPDGIDAALWRPAVASLAALPSARREAAYAFLDARTQPASGGLGLGAQLHQAVDSASYAPTTALRAPGSPGVGPSPRDAAVASAPNTLKH